MDNTLASVEVSVSDPAELRSLREHLREAPAIEIRQFPGVPTDGALWAGDVLQVLVASGDALAHVARMIHGFVRSRDAGVSVTVKIRDKTVTITAANAEDLMSVVENVVTSAGGAAMGGGRGAGMGGLVPPGPRVRAGEADEEHQNRLPTINKNLFHIDEPLSPPVIGQDWLDQPELPLRPRTDRSDVSVTIYLEDGTAHEDVEIAVGQALTAAGLYITERGDPVIGSWWRVFRATARQTAATPVAREAVAVAAHAAEQRVVLDKDADITAKLLQNLGPVITALQPEQNAVVRLGAALIVKANGVLVVHQLTSTQQLKLNHNPHLLQSPRDILTALASASDDGGSLPAIGL